MRLIDADVLIDKFKNKDANGINLALDRYAIKCIEDAPTIEERKTGEWISSRPDAPMFGFYYCSICGRRRTSPQDNFCPNCGADMMGAP